MGIKHSKILIQKRLPRILHHLFSGLDIENEVNEHTTGLKVEDGEIFEYVIDQDFVIITADVDFGKLLAFSKGHRPSVISSESQTKRYRT